MVNRTVVLATQGTVEPRVADLAVITERASALAALGIAPATRRAYASDWRAFVAWCASVGMNALPATPETVGLFLAAEADRLALATLERRLATIATTHRAAGMRLDTRHPSIRAVLRGLRREKGIKRRQVEALSLSAVRMLVATCCNNILGIRDRALLLLGFSAALRRSELVTLEVGDLLFFQEGLQITVRRSKTDQNGAGQDIAISRTGTPTCPVAAVEAWLAAVAIDSGRLFRRIDRHGHVGEFLSDRAVALIVKKRAGAAGLEPALFAGHSLRAGFATAAAAAGIEERDIAEVTRHRSVTVLRAYIRRGAAFRRNLTAEIGL